MASDRKLVVVANRLPVRHTGDGWETSPGGLVSALAPILRAREGSWVGWTGTADQSPEPFELDGIRQVPVHLSQEDIEAFYEGFCNGTLWPLYHDAIRTPEFHRHWWRPYQAVNTRFAEAAASAMDEDDVVWVHDYQLQLVPGMLRRLRPEARIGFYLHIPFPPVEVFARIPWRREIIAGLLGADVVAFQTRLGRHNFSRAARRFLGATGGTRLLEHEGRQVRLQDAPIAIDTAGYQTLARTPEVVDGARRLRDELGDRRMVLGVDRLDYTKGINVRLRAFETLLEQTPNGAKEFVFVQVAVPSREAIDEYAGMRAEIEQMVGRINGDFGSPGTVPVHYLYRSLPAEELVSYYLVADVMAVTPLRDGMNLVAKEYVATRLDDTGVLVLSEFAGAAQELQHALLVNPYDLDGVAATLQRAVELPPAEIRARMAALRRQVETHDVFRWARTCLAAIER